MDSQNQAGADSDSQGSGIVDDQAGKALDYEFFHSRMQAIYKLYTAETTAWHPDSYSFTKIERLHNKAFFEKMFQSIPILYLDFVCKGGDVNSFLGSVSEDSARAGWLSNLSFQLQYKGLLNQQSKVKGYVESNRGEQTATFVRGVKTTLQGLIRMMGYNQAFFFSMSNSSSLDNYYFLMALDEDGVIVLVDLYSGISVTFILENKRGYPKFRASEFMMSHLAKFFSFIDPAQSFEVLVFNQAIHHYDPNHATFVDSTLV